MYMKIIHTIDQFPKHMPMVERLLHEAVLQAFVWAKPSRLATRLASQRLSKEKLLSDGK